jgi:hypothetical protein
MMIQRPLEAETIIRPVHLLTVGEQEQTPAPLIRVGTCGLLTLEILQEIVSPEPPQARYAVLTGCVDGASARPSVCSSCC